MIRCETIGGIQAAKINPVLKSDTDVVNNTFVEIDDDLWLVANSISGDDSYREDVVIPAGEFLNGYLVKSLEGLKLVVDGKHVDGGISDVSEGDILVAREDGKLASGEAAGVHFVVTDKTVLTEAAVKVKVVVAA